MSADRLDPTSKYFTMAEVAKVLGWPTRRARRWLVKNDAVVKINSKWVTTKAKLRESFKDAWDEYFFDDYSDRE